MNPQDRLKRLIVLAIACLAGHVSAADSMPVYEPGANVRGEIRVTGDIEDLELIETLQAEFGRHQPNVHFKNSLHGPESTLAGVYTGTSDLAFMAREIREPLERMAFEWAKLAKPYAVVFANAGFEKHRPGTQLAVFVHGENPVDVLSLAELDAIFGAEHKRGSKNIRFWGEVGASGEWRERPVHVFAPELDSLSALFFRRLVMHDSRKWNPGLVEFSSPDEALRALSNDPSGIALAPVAYQRPDLKALAIFKSDSNVGVSLTRATAIAQEYPLHRSVSLVLHRPDLEPLVPRVREFLRFVLSREGQAIIDRDGTYLPLSASVVLSERQRLKP